MSGKIFGYDWEDIQRAQQGGSLTQRKVEPPTGKSRWNNVIAGRCYDGHRITEGCSVQWVDINLSIGNTPMTVTKVVPLTVRFRDGVIGEVCEYHVRVVPR